MELSTVTYAVDGGVARVVLNRPAQLNAISPGLGGVWTPDVWAPLAGRVINAGVSARL